MKNPLLTGTMIALAAGSLFAAACSKNEAKPTTPATTMEKTAAAVHCMGINSCKGQGSCKSAKNACKGQNSCKGEGMTPSLVGFRLCLKFSEPRNDVFNACTARGGTPLICFHIWS